MATIQPVLPALSPFVARVASTLSASDTVPLQANSKYLLHLKNATGGNLTLTLDDPTSVTPSGATAFNPDVPSGAVPLTTGEGYMIIQSDRFRDTNGNMTMTGASGLQFTCIGPL
jgi:hypothetical protein